MFLISVLVRKLPQRPEQLHQLYI